MWLAPTYPRQLPPSAVDPQLLSTIPTTGIIPILPVSFSLQSRRDVPLFLSKTVYNQINPLASLVPSVVFPHVLGL